MLGTALIRELRRLGANVYQYREPFDWKNPERIRAQFVQAVKEFLAGFSSGDRWEIYWAAGMGSMGSGKADLGSETAALGSFIASLRDQLPACKAVGVIGFSSSAGALYASCTDFEITEASVVSAANDYARTKLSQEQMLESFVSAVDGVQLLIARFSTLFGPGQAFDKRQGLLSHIARCALKHQPVEIFVPLDTSRDYLFVDDAARDFIASSRALCDHGSRLLVKIISAERSVTISEIVSTFNRLIKKRLRIVCNRNNLSDVYAPRVAYRSIFPLIAGAEFNRHTLLEGAAVLLHAERMAYIAGSQKK
jgi:UDP-glucose 4-epimerase